MTQRGFSKSFSQRATEAMPPFLGRIYCRIYWRSSHTVHKRSSGSQWRSGLCSRSTFDRVALLSPTSRHCAVTQDESGRRLRFALRHGPLPASGKPLRQLGELGGSGGYLGGERDGGRKRCSRFMMSLGFVPKQRRPAAPVYRKQLIAVPLNKVKPP